MDEPQIILFIGDPYRCDRALAKREEEIFSGTAGGERRTVYADEADPSSLGVDLRSSSLFSSRRHFVIRGIERAQAEAALAAAITREISDGTFVSLIATELKGKSPILKACRKRGAVVSLPAPRGRGMTRAAAGILAERGVEVEEESIDVLLNRTGGRLIALAREAEKLRSFARTGGLTGEAVERLAFPNAEQTVYPFYDRLGEGDLTGAIAGIRELDEDPTLMLSGAIRHLTRLAMIRLLLDRKTPAKRIGGLVGLPDWLARRLIAQAKLHGIDRLISLLDLAVGLDLEVKAGRIPAFDALLKLVFAATSPQRPGRG